MFSLECYQLTLIRKDGVSICWANELSKASCCSILRKVLTLATPQYFLLLYV